MNSLFLIAAILACVGVVTSSVALGEAQAPVSAVMALAISCYVLGTVVYAVFVK